MRTPGHDRHLATAVGLLALAAIALTGCASMQAGERSYRLKAATSGYAYAIRWGKLREASAFTKLRDRNATPPPIDFSTYDGIKVISVEVSPSAMNITNDEAKVDLSIGYHWEDTVTIQSVGQPTIWWWDDVDGRWYLDGTVPELP